MKKRGFTLVELLAVIVILGVVFLFIVPRLSTLIKKGEKNQKDILIEHELFVMMTILNLNTSSTYLFYV